MDFVSWKVNLVITIIACIATTCLGGFTSGAPCSDRNTVTPPFRAPAEVKCLDITQLHRTDLQRMNFASMNYRDRFDTLYADAMGLSVMPIRVLQALPNLELVDLSRNSITKFPNNAFSNLHRLNILLLDKNQIVIPRRQNLIDSSSLTTLKLSNNGIERVFPFTFHNLYSLKALYLDGNRLKRVPYLAFRPLHMLKYLDLSNNQILRLPSNNKLPPKLVKFMVQGNLAMMRAPYGILDEDIHHKKNGSIEERVPLGSIK